MKTVYFVTGGCGFIGANFIQYLLNKTKPKSVINLDKLTYAGNQKNLADFEQDPRYIFVHGDICDAELVSKLFTEYQPNYIVNFAAESHVDRSIDGPAEFIQTNIVGTSVLLQEALKYYSTLKGGGSEHFRFHHVSTDEVYGALG